jgi:Cu-processing system permease protein
MSTNASHRTPAPFVLCARQELTLAARSRWAQSFAWVFAGLALAVAASGYVLSGGRGVQDFARTGASLVQLVLLLTPLASLVIGVLALAPDRGAAELLFAQPVSRRSVLLGKLVGLFAALAAAQAAGLATAGIVIFSRSDASGLAGYAGLYGAALVLTAVFLAIAAALASGPPGRRTRALVLALIVWFATVVLVDVAALGVASLLPSRAASRTLIAAVLLNPVAAVRTGALLGIQGTAAFGPASLALLRFTKGPVGAAALIGLSGLLWIAVPAWIAARRMERADL